MTPFKENRTPAARIMIVDDHPANLKLLHDMLKQRGYDVRCFPRGRLALASAQENPPDLVLLDVNMPEMSGYEVCERFRELEEIPGIPVLFISALNQTDDKIKGFRAGGADYITKPLQFEEVHARVATHLKLRRARLAEQELLERTLSGAMAMLSDLLHANAPEISIRSQSVREIAAWIAKRFEAPEPALPQASSLPASSLQSWECDIAATLCLIGCVTLPQEVFRAAYADGKASPEEAAMFRAHPETAALLLKHLPRLDAIAEMIRLQQDPEKESAVATPEIRLGARVLFLALELDRRLHRGIPVDVALQQIKSLGTLISPELLDALNDYSPASGDLRRDRVPIRKLLPGMVLDWDVLSEKTGFLIFPKGTVLTAPWIERLENFKASHGVAEPLPVLAPRVSKPLEVRRLLRRRVPEKRGAGRL